MLKRKICVFTGSRADYGLLQPLLRAIQKDRGLQLQILVSGMHLSRPCGMTYKQIEQDGFTIDQKVDMILVDDTCRAISQSVGIGIQRMSKALETLDPAIVVVLGDRFEALSCAVSAFLMHIPLAHLHGGEATYGVIDEQIRHAITKLSQLHFTSTSVYRDRVIQMGEDPRRVWHVGALGLETMRELHGFSRQEIEKRLGIVFKKKNLLITFHPETQGGQRSADALGELLDALDTCRDTLFIFTKPNADEGSRVLRHMIEQYVAQRRDHAVAYANLGSHMYLSCMRMVDGVVGNSSSGIIEAPSYKIGTINIGQRQAGRIAAESVIHCKAEKSAIVNALKRMYSPAFKGLLKKVRNPYHTRVRASTYIIQVLKRIDLNTLERKEFYVHKDYCKA